MRILICGSRDFAFPEVIQAWMEWNTPWIATVIHGDAKGADSMADYFARDQVLTVEKYPADWTKYRLTAGPIRNQQMLDEGKPDRVAAFFTDLNTSKGTRDMVTRSLKAGLPVTAIEARVISEDELREKLGLPKKTIAPDN